MIVKTCFKCGKTKPINEFYKHPEMADGYLGKCKECTKNDVRENYRKNIDHYIKYEQNRYKSAKRKQDLLTYQRRRRRKYPLKYRARTITSNTIRDGKLIRQPCEICHTQENIEAHHDDYSKPLEIRWLCYKHHREVHGQETYK